MVMGVGKGTREAHLLHDAVIGASSKTWDQQGLGLRFSPSLSQPVPWASFCTPPCLGFLISKVGRQCPPGSVFEG